MTADPNPRIFPTLPWFLFSFRGRIGRWQFWQYVLVLCVFVVAEQTAIKLFGLPSEKIETLSALLLLYPNLAVMVKRWHDRDRSAWWLLLLAIPVIGQGWIVVECGFLKGSDGPNRFGQRPDLDDWSPIPRHRHGRWPGEDA